MAGAREVPGTASPWKAALATIVGSVLLVGLLVAVAAKPHQAPADRGIADRGAADRGAESRAVLDQARAPFGLSERAAWTTSRVVGSPDPPPPYKTGNAFPRLRFRNPVVLAKPPGLNRWFVGEQGGRVFSFVDDRNCAQADLALDVDRQLLAPAIAGSRVSDVDNRAVRGLEALYGLTFHPQFAQNRYCYVCYVVRGDNGQQLPDGTRVSRFRVTESDPPQLDPASEQVVISWLQGGHNGGCLAFGPEGYLYISTGDGGFANPPDGRNSGQDVTNLLSCVLRIDVDHAESDRPYRIPTDNPLLAVPEARGEIWCFGLRNPWKMSFDRQTGELWVGDVGWELWELVYRVERGGNYGWSVVEGRQAVHPERKVGPTPILPPTVEIPHTDGVSVTGGYVYRGQRFPELVGQYLFGDWETRRLWGVTWDAATKMAGPRRDLVDPLIRLVAFAEDDQGEILMVDYDDGTIHELLPNQVAPSEHPFPQLLSETGLFEFVAEEAPAAGVYAFSVNSPQWADGAVARRWIAVPERQTVKMLPQKLNVRGSMFSSSTIFPVNTVLAKTFSLPVLEGEGQGAAQAEVWRRVETQLLHYDGRFWRGYSYQWNDDQTDARLVGPLGGEATYRVRQVARQKDAAAVVEQTWHFASRVECARCHNQWAEYALAFNVRQLNRMHDYPMGRDNQLRTFEHVGVVQLPPDPGQTLRVVAGQADEVRDPASRPAEWYAAQYPRLADPYDASQPLEQRSRSYLHANCAHCHRGGGGGTAYIELQEELPLDATKAIDVRPTQGTFEIPEARIIAPGDPFRSTLFFRISKTGAGRMPHIGSEVVDQAGVRLIHDWIASLPPRVEDATLIGRLRDADEATALDREAQDAPRRQLEIAQRLANERRDRQRAAAGEVAPPSAEPAAITPADLEAARGEDERRGVERARDRATARKDSIERLLATTSRSLMLARVLDESPLPAGVQAQLVAAALVHPSPVVRDLFDRFAPPERRLKRLGAHVKAAEILALEGDIARGAVLFADTAGVQCKNCHRIGRIGGQVGPELTTIGRKYNRAQLLEHILEPSKVIDPKYVSYVAALTDGRVISGLLTNRTADEFVFRDAKDREICVAAADVESFAPQRQSLMPDLLLRDLNPQQVADLLSYLADLK